MNRLTTALICLTFYCQGIVAQNYSKAKVILDGASAVELARLGMAIDHVDYQPGDFVIGDFSDFELNQARTNGFKVEILEPDASQYYLKNRHVPSHQRRTNQECIEALQNFQYQTPRNFTKGSLIGNFSYEEMLGHLDKMAFKFPGLVSKKQAIGSFLTHEGRPIYWVRISNNPGINDPEKHEILYTGLHHAREPVSMTQMIFFMWYMLENYGKDKAVTNVIDEVEMYFIPCVNPDGYVYNETLYPQGGGLWRKNRKPNDDGTYGVDLNRNYGYQWGIDNVGSSNISGSEVYRGPAPFSEPETQAVRAFCTDHDFHLSLNYHTYGNFLIYPYGYTSEPAEEADLYRELASLLTKENRYIFGTGVETVAYSTNGDSDDWMYGDTSTKDRIFAMTSEIGLKHHGFWPSEDDVLFLCKSTLKQNLDAARFLLNSGLFQDESEPFLMDHEGEFPFKVTKLGFDDAGLQVTFEPETDNIEITQPSRFYILDVFSSVRDKFEYKLKGGIKNGDPIRLVMTLDNGIVQKRETIQKFFWNHDLQFSNSGDLKGWDLEGVFSQWGESRYEYFSMPNSLTDSPNGHYLPYSINRITMKDPALLTDGDSVILTFKAKWDIQTRTDYLLAEISTDGNTFQPLCGQYTTVSTRSDGLPAYSGTQDSWISERIDLTEYLGQEVLIRFTMYANGNDTRDGFYIDDIRLLVYEQNALDTRVLSHTEFNYRVYPNPAEETLQVDHNGTLSLKELSRATVQLISLLGNPIRKFELDESSPISLSDFSPGLYFVRIQLADGRQSGIKKVVVK